MEKAMPITFETNDPQLLLSTIKYNLRRSSEWELFGQDDNDITIAPTRLGNWLNRAFFRANAKLDRIEFEVVTPGLADFMDIGRLHGRFIEFLLGTMSAYCSDVLVVSK
jgi:hypothetical protein